MKIPTERRMKRVSIASALRPFLMKASTLSEVPIATNVLIPRRVPRNVAAR